MIWLTAVLLWFGEAACTSAVEAVFDVLGVGDYQGTTE